MKLLDLQQGTGDWLRHRAACLNASDAPAMMGVSPYRTRADLIRQKATGIEPEYDPSTLARFRAGHEAEAGIRPHAESLIGEELYPVVGEQVFDGLRLSASFDGLTLAGDIGFESKIWNAALAASVREGTVPESHIWQVVHQHAVGNLEKTLFVVSDGTPEKCVWCWVTVTPEQITRLLAGWKQFAADVAAYQPEPVAADVVASEPDALPAVFVQVEGRVVAGDMRAHRAMVSDWVAKLPAKFETDQDFADGAAAVKHCTQAEADLKALAGQVRGQMVSVDEVFRLIEDSVAEIAAARLRIDKAVKGEKERRREEIVLGARRSLQVHWDRHNAILHDDGVSLPQPSWSVFGEAVKGLKTIASIREKCAVALGDEIARVDSAFDTYTGNLLAYRDLAAGYSFLFRDLQQLVGNPSPEGFIAIVTQRIDRHRAEEAARMEAERARIRAEEQARAEREAATKARAEQDARDVEARRLENERDALSHGFGPAPVVAQVAPVVTPTDDGKTLKLGEICERLGFTITAAFLSTLGFEPVATDKSAKLYRASDFHRICAALVQHIQSVASQAA